MSPLVLFHHVLGLTDGVTRFADELRRRGFVVHTPDLFEGRVFDSFDEGFAYVREVGFETLLDRAAQACADLTEPAVFGGISLGVMPAMDRLMNQPSRGAVLLCSFVDPNELSGTWPEVPVHVYAMDADPFFVDDGDQQAAEAFQVDHDNLEIHTYPGSGHLFLDSSHADYDAEITRDVLEHVSDSLRHMLA